METITITQEDYAKATAKAMTKFREMSKDTEARPEAVATMMLEFLFFQNLIFRELFDREEENYA